MTDGEQDFSAFEQQQNEPPASEPPAPEDEAHSAPEDGEPPIPEAPKPKPTAQDRIDELTRKRHEADRATIEANREAKYWRDVAEGRVKANGGPAPAKEDKAPNPDDYDFGKSDERYIEAVIDYRVERGLKKGLDEVRGGVAQDLQVQASERAWEAKQEVARSEFADYDQKVIQEALSPSRPDGWPCSPDMAEAIRTSDVGGKLAYHLASHPEEARRIVGLNPYAQVREIGRIEASLESGTPPVKTTNAPKPPGNQARGAGGAFAADGSTKDFAAFEALANRKAG